jgi:hypothetical protein
VVEISQIPLAHSIFLDAIIEILKSQGRWQSNGSQSPIRIAEHWVSLWKKPLPSFWTQVSYRPGAYQSMSQERSQFNKTSIVKHQCANCGFFNDMNVRSFTGGKPRQFCMLCMTTAGGKRRSAVPTERAFRGRCARCALEWDDLKSAGRSEYRREYRLKHRCEGQHVTVPHSLLMRSDTLMTPYSPALLACKRTAKSHPLRSTNFLDIRPNFRSISVNFLRQR